MCPPPSVFQAKLSKATCSNSNPEFIYHFNIFREAFWIQIWCCGWRHPLPKHFPNISSFLCFVGWCFYGFDQEVDHHGKTTILGEAFIQVFGWALFVTGGFGWFFVCLSSPRFVKHPCILKALEIQNEVQVFFCISVSGGGDCRFPRLIRLAHKVSSCYIYHFPFRTSRPFQPLQTSEPVQKLLAFQDRVVVSRTHKFWWWFEVWDRGADWLVWILHPISSQFHTIVAFFWANGRRAGINHVIYSWNNLS